MKAKLEHRGGIDYLTFTPSGMETPTMIPVITKGSRKDSGAWTWNSSLEKPSVKPSIRTKYVNSDGVLTEIHYWLTDGICNCLNDCKDGNSGKKLSLLECEG